MLICTEETYKSVVALLAEGVDRNRSARAFLRAATVALLAEGVDRNPQGASELLSCTSRPPRGGRG